MSLGRNRYTIHKVGEYSQLAGTTYYGGQPCAINTSGTLEKAISDGSTTYVGIFANYSAVDAKTKDVKSTFYAGTCVLTLMKATPNVDNRTTNVEGTAGVDGDDYPYNTTLVYNEGDKLYVGADGLWTNVNPGSKQALGVVLYAGTNSLTVLFNNLAGAVI